MPETLLQVKGPSEVSQEQLAAAPLVINYMLTSQVTIQTTVLGDARNIATVSIIDGSLTMWSTTLTQAAPNATTPYALVMGTVTIDAGAGFELTIPTSVQNGSVMFNGTIVQAGNSSPYAAQVSSWPLTS
jgi:hypothetical protein